MSSGNWIDADFSGLHGLADKFSSSNIEKCRFVESDLTGLALRSNNIKNSDFSRSNLGECRFSSANILRGTFAGCDFSRSEFSRCNVTDCDFSGANLTGVTAKWSNLTRMKLTDAVLFRTKFSCGQFTELTFTGEMTECSFENCDFARVIFDGAVMRECFFKNAKLRRVHFTGCRADKLTYAFLKSCKADLTGVAVMEDET